MPRSLIALGSNLGDRAQTLRRAVRRLAAAETTSGLACSSFRETRPIGGPTGQQGYLNAAVACDTSLSPAALHDLLRRIETELGRRPAPRWAARAIDLDLLLYGDHVVATPSLLVPHPRLAFRRFVLAPSAEVAGAMPHPLIGWTIERLLAHLDSATPYVALLGLPQQDRAALAQRAAGAVEGTYLALGTGFELSAAAGDPSGHAEQPSIQFLDRAGSLLAAGDWQKVAISDFFFDEPLAYAGLWPSADARRRVRTAWQTRLERVVRPKLLVVLERWEEGLRARSAPVTPSTTLRDELLKLANRSDQGPVLFAGRDDPQAQFEEITAAIAAMA